MKTKKMRVVMVFFILFFAILTAVSTAFAVDSINPGDLRPVVVNPGGTGTTPAQNNNTGEAVVVEADPSRYSNEAVRNIVAAVNSDAGGLITPAAVITALIESQPESKSDPESFPTTTGIEINTVIYDNVTGFLDLGLQTGNGISLDGTPGTLTIKVPQTVGMDGESLLIMQIHPTTGEVFLIPLTAFDSETGELTADFANFGPFAIVGKIPIVNREVDPDRYPDQDVAKIVRSVSSTEYLNFGQWMKAQGIHDATFTFKVQSKSNGKGNTKKKSDAAQIVYAAEEGDTITINVDDYEAVTYVTDTAIREGVQDFSYDLSTRMKANLYQNLDRANWTRILKYAGVKFNTSKIEKNPELLEEIEPFVLEKAFIYHIDAATGEVSIIYEPTIYFDTYNEDIGDKVELQQDQDTGESQTGALLNNLFDSRVSAEMKPVDQDKVSRVYCDDIDEDNTANLCMVISGDGYLGLGPFALFLPKSSVASSLWWIFLLLAILIIAVIVYLVIRYRRQDN